MRFSITIPDDTTYQIDTEADKEGVSRSQWIYQACIDKLTRSAPQTHQERTTPHQESIKGDEPSEEMVDLRIRCEYQEQTIKDLREERGYLRGEIARLQQANDLLTGRLLPPPKAGIFTRLKRAISPAREE
ncbi:MAG: ribbon-helix-helix domain-containing protein [Lachnospiraceae bacterium]|jgi:uncharacterized coiled-coil protein SlyX|uniref:Ribbon-helix-helix protein CopG domain-containing protein n=1 Tax=Methanocalculus taiwanensis TaxID=106207 RepID=A0ABD4TQM1_9EURY|nr:CopG family transcriptional regulator [Methanocalculus taiwanensis]MCQ1539595.1 hypothetical protein [Methanocalculus taiwanensis]MDD2973442.1 ribbon-helix-helix domain-containing protein [Lachnospiraceae bacterium]